MQIKITDHKTKEENQSIKNCNLIFLHLMCLFTLHNVEKNSDLFRSNHRLRPIDTHLALYPMLYNNSAKNRYAEPVLNKTKQISKIRD